MWLNRCFFPCMFWQLKVNGGRIPWVFPEAISAVIKLCPLTLFRTVVILAVYDIVPVS